MVNVRRFRRDRSRNPKGPEYRPDAYGHIHHGMAPPEYRVADNHRYRRNAEGEWEVEVAQWSVWQKRWFKTYLSGEREFDFELEPVGPDFTTKEEAEAYMRTLT